MILDSIEYVVAKMKHLRINSEAIERFCEGISAEDLAVPSWRLSFMIGEDSPNTIRYFMLMNSLNFAYWEFEDCEEWTFDYGGETYDGAFAMFACLNAAFERGLPIFDGEYLANLSEEQLSGILYGGGTIPLFGERLRILRTTGEELNSKYGGDFFALYEAAEGDAVRLVELLVQGLSGYHDVARYKGRQVLFYKRAMLAVAMIYGRFEGRGLGALARTEQLQLFADYKIPQILRGLGILEYGAELSEKIDGEVFLERDGEKEIEIRAAMVWAGKLIVDRLREKGLDDVTALRLDYYLWKSSIDFHGESRPHHLVETTNY